MGRQDSIISAVLTAFVWVLGISLTGTVAQAASVASGSYQQKCADWTKAGYKKRPGGYTSVDKQPYTMTMPEYRAWLREVRRRNPHKSWQEIITNLHRQHQTSDDDLWLPVLGYTNVAGPENDDHRDVDVACYAKNPINGELIPNTPYRVVDHEGRLIDVTHIYAALRSDMNREKDSYLTTVMRCLNNDCGDIAQHVLMGEMWDFIEVPTPFSIFSGGKVDGIFLPNWNIYDKWGHFWPTDQQLGNRIGWTAAEIFKKEPDPDNWVDALMDAFQREGFISRVETQIEQARTRGGCKPKAPSTSTGLDPGFVGQTHGPIESYDPDCPPMRELLGRDGNSAQTSQKKQHLQPATDMSPDRQDLRGQAESIMSEIEGNLQKAEGFFTRLQQQCSQILRADRADHWGALEKVKAQVLDPARERARSELEKIDEDKTAAEQLSKVVEQSGERARTERERSCRIKVAGESDVELIREAARRAREQAAEASRAGKEAQARLEAARARTKSDRPPVPGDLKDRFTSMHDAAKKVCGIVRETEPETFHPWGSAKKPGAAQKLSEADAGLDRLRTLLENPDLPDQAEFANRTSALARRAQAAASKEVDASACAAAYHRLRRKVCGSRRVNLPAEIEREFNDYWNGYRDAIKERRLALVGLRLRLDRNERHINDAEVSARQARECLDAAHPAEPKSEPETAGNTAGCKLKAPSTSTGLDPGFIGQTHGPVEGHDPNCPPVGKTAERADPEPVDCAVALDRYKAAREAYRAGNAQAYRRDLRAAAQAMASFPEGACSGLSDRIARGREQADVLEKVNNSAGELLSTCKGADPRVQAAKMREMAGLLGKTIQPHIQRLVQRLNAAEQAALTYAETRDAFHAGNIDSARQRLGIARNRLDAVDAGDCPDLRAAITKAPRVLDNWGRAADATDQAAAACNIEQMERLVSKFRGANSLTGSALVARLNMALPECREKERERERQQEVARQREQEEYRRASCKSGYYPGPANAAGEFYCLPTKTTADAWCNNNNKGKGYYAVNIKADGSHGCLPTRERANADCRAANPGRKGVYGEVNADGSVDCKQTESAAQSESIASGHRACQSANNNRRARAAKYLGNGRWSCYIPGRRPNRTVTKRQPGITAGDIATGMAVVGGVLNQMQRRSGQRHRPLGAPRWPGLIPDER